RADAAIRSAWLAACGARVCGEEAVYLGVLAPDHYSDCLVVQESRRGGDEHNGVRRAMDAQSDRVAGIWYRAGKFFTRRIAGTGGDGAAAGRGTRLRVHDRR